MKRILIASILGITALSASFEPTYGQGNLYFDNLVNDSYYMPVKVLNFYAADSNIHVDLWYYLGVTSDPNQLVFSGYSMPINPARLDPMGHPGYVDPTLIFIPSYASGPVTFMVRGSTPGGLQGASFLWQEPQLGPPLTTPYLQGLPGPDGSPLVVLVPEPSSWTLGAVGLVLTATRRRLLRLRARSN